MYACAHATIDNETNDLTGFSSRYKLFAFIRRFFVRNNLPTFFKQQLSLFFENLIHQGTSLVFNDNTPLLSNSKPHMLQLIKQIQAS